MQFSWKRLIVAISRKLPNLKKVRLDIYEHLCKAGKKDLSKFREEFLPSDDNNCFTILEILFPSLSIIFLPHSKVWPF